MMQTNSYQTPGQTVVVVQQGPHFGNRVWTNRGPMFLRQGVQLGGMMIGLHMIVCMAAFGAFFTFGGIMFISLDSDKEFWSHFDRTHGPATTMGSILLVVGLIMLTASIVIGCIAKKKYEQNRGNRTDDPGRVINPPPSGTYPPQQPGQAFGAAPYGVYPGTQYPPGTQFPPGTQMAPHPQGPPGVPVAGGYAPVGPSPSYPPNPSSNADLSSAPFLSSKDQNPYAPPSGPPADPSKPSGSEYDAPPPYSPGFKP